jgi:hypothetical protein
MVVKRTKNGTRAEEGERRERSRGRGCKEKKKRIGQWTGLRDGAQWCILG